jgi:cell wall-associated NlpC family hydrolase
LSQYGLTGDFSVGPSGADIPGATANNPGAKAVALAMKAVQNHTPYVWGGNSLTRGVDCSGLVQQVYRQLGISLPRTTYEQAKSGRRVSTTQLRPGELVFYNTGSRDPNGIGTYGHVAIYMGNGKVVEAANSRAGLRVSNLTGYNGAPAAAVRPY